jgi:hypothetical protein
MVPAGKSRVSFSRSIVLASLFTGKADSAATVLTWRGLEGVDFELGVEVDDEFSHEGAEGDFARFASLAQVLVEVAQDGIAAAADQSGHVEGLASGRSGCPSPSRPLVQSLSIAPYPQTRHPQRRPILLYPDVTRLLYRHLTNLPQTGID